MDLCLDGRCSAARSVVALGMFDGVHIGHQVLLRRARTLAQRYDAPMVVQTFATHPLQLLRPESCPPMLTTLEERGRLIEALGADVLNATPFTPETRDIAPEDFVGLLVRQWHPAAVVVGYNYTFGKNGKGTPAWLAALGAALGFATSIVPEIRLDEQSVSSTRIRELLSACNAASAARLLGRPYLREAQSVSSRDGLTRLTFTPNGKLLPAAGRYRALLALDGRSVPVALRVTSDGDARCGLSLPPRTAVELRLLAGCRVGV